MTWRNDGRVGIGTSSPGSTFHVDGTARFTPGSNGLHHFQTTSYRFSANQGVPVYMEVSNSGSEAQMRIRSDANNNNSTARSLLLLQIDGSVTKGSFAYIETEDLLKISHGGYGSNHITIKPSGDVAIGHDDAQAPLDVAGEVKIGSSGLSCDAGTAGAIRFSSALDCQQICLGSEWICVGAFTNLSECSDNQPLVFNNADKTIRCGPVDVIPPLWVTPSGVIATTNIGIFVSENVYASDESGTPTYSKVSGAGWINVAGDGTVSGMAPSSSGTYNVVVRATDGSGNTSDRSFDIVVNEGDGPADCPNPQGNRVWN